MHILHGIASRERTQPVKVAVRQPDAPQRAMVAAAEEQGIKLEGLVSPVVQVEKSLAGVQRVVEPRRDRARCGR